MVTQDSTVHMQMWLIGRTPQGSSESVTDHTSGVLTTDLTTNQEKTRNNLALKQRKQLNKVMKNTQKSKSRPTGPSSSVRTAHMSVLMCLHAQL